MKLLQRITAIMPPEVNVEIGRLSDRSTWKLTGGSPEQRAAAQSILDSFDPIAAQAEVEAEEAEERTRAEKLRALAEWLRTQTKDVREKFADMQADLDLARAAIIDLRARVKALEEA